jgi:hypothetical protein
VHQAGIVHRDLKPSNVLLADDGPMVIDFGIAQAVDEVERTQGELVLGTPVTMAPERYQGGAVTPAADVFSWGCVVAYAANGVFPFGEGQAFEIGYRVLHEEPDLGTLDGELRALVALALAKDPAQRPAVEYLMARLLGEKDPERQRAAAVTFVRRAWPLAGLGLAPWGLARLAAEPPAPPAPPPPAPSPPPLQPVTTAIRRVGSLSKKALTGKGGGVGQLVVQHKIIAAVVGATVVAAGAGIGVPRVFAAKPVDAVRSGQPAAAGPLAPGGGTSSTLDPGTTAGGTTTTSATTTTVAGAAGTPSSSSSTSSTSSTTSTTRAITASASAVSAAPGSFKGTCPVSVTFSATISVTGGPVTVRFQWIRSDEAGGAVRTVRFDGSGAQSRTVRTIMSVGSAGGGDFSASAQLRLLSPSALTTARKTFVAACATPPRLSASVRVSPTTFTGACPHVFTFTAVISITNGPATVRYRWTRADGATAPLETITFAQAGPASRTVQTTWTLGGAPNSYSLWQSIRFESEPGTANRANFTLTCTS